MLSGNGYFKVKGHVFRFIFMCILDRERPGWWRYDNKIVVADL